MGSSLAFAAGFLAACAVLARLVDPTPVGGGRIEWVRDHAADYDTLFVGSSRTFRQVMPSVFDAAMAEAGEPTRSFNLALPGMRPPEDAYVIERALDGRTAPLRFLVVECNPVRIGIPPEDRETARSVYWHDARRLRVLAGRALAPSSVDPDAPLDAAVVRQHLIELADHARHWLWNATRLGRGAELLRDALVDLHDRRPALRLGPDGDGFQPRPPGRPTFGGEEREVYLAALRERLERPHRIRYGDSESQAELRRKRALAERHGGRLVLVSPPYLNDPFAPLPALGIPFLDFADPRRYPELFAPENRNDGGHLNTRGAELYSRLLARALRAALAGEPAP
jgi:hypothetical protein